MTTTTTVPIRAARRGRETRAAATGAALRTAVRFTGNLVLAAAEVIVLGTEVDHGDTDH